MSNYWENQNSPHSNPQVQSTTSGLHQFFTQTYTWMALGLALTGLLAVIVASNQSLQYFFLANPMIYFGLIIAEIVLVIAFTRMAARGASFPVLLGMFISYAALNGLTFSVIFLVYTSQSIASAFFVTAASFAALSFYGFVTKKDLSAMGRFLFMAVIGLIIASVVNIFVASSGLYFLISIAGVLIFAGLTAYDTQKLKNLYFHYQHDSNALQRLSLRGALSLYLDFINLMLFLLRLMGDRR